MASGSTKVIIAALIGFIIKYRRRKGVESEPSPHHNTALEVTWTAIPLVLVVVIFLQTWRASIIPLLAVPVSIIGTLAVLLAFGFSINVLTLLGMLREIIGFGTLLAQADLMFGESARALKITLADDYGGFLLAILPPGAFMGLGMLIALKNLIDKRLSGRQPASSGEAEPATA